MVLTPHPGNPSGGALSLDARVSWTKSGALAFGYALAGDLDRLNIPPPAAPARADGLWRHTCFEAFVSFDGDAAYYEFNFAPSGEWAVYRFKSYRVAAPAPTIAEPAIDARRTKDALKLDASARLDLSRHERLKIALSAVVEDRSGGLNYWALEHPPGKPDFHHPDAFVLELKVIPR